MNPRRLVFTSLLNRAHDKEEKGRSIYVHPNNPNTPSYLVKTRNRLCSVGDSSYLPARLGGLETRTAIAVEKVHLPRASPILVLDFSFSLALINLGLGLP